MQSPEVSPNDTASAWLNTINMLKSAIQRNERYERKKEIQREKKRDTKRERPSERERESERESHHIVEEASNPLWSKKSGGTLEEHQPE